MTTYYVNCNAADDTGNGTSWGTAKKTLNAVENLPVAGDDIVYVAPGTYRELLTCDVSGTAGHTITYIGDVDGSHTDGVGGIVRITGSNDDLTATRAGCIDILTRNYRTFQGFVLDFVTVNLIRITSGTNQIIQDCYFTYSPLDVAAILVYGATTNNTFQRNIFAFFRGYGINEVHDSLVDNRNDLIQNNLFIGQACGVMVRRIGGLTIKNNTFISNYTAIECTLSPNAGQVNGVYNNTISGCRNGLLGVAAGDFTSNYNSVYGCIAAYTQVVAGANDNTFPPHFNPPILLSGYKYPWNFGELAPWSPVRAIAGTGEATDDLFGRARPATAAKNSWGAVQFSDTVRETTTKRTGTASIKFEDAGRHQIWVPTTNVSTTFSVYVYREADYAGTNPQMIIKQPGQADTVVLDAEAAEQWNLLTSTFTPAASPGYCVVELVSNNTNTANAATNDVFFDDLTVV